MKKLLYLAFLISAGALAQVSSPSVIYQANAPSGACSPYPPIQVVSSTGVIYTCNNGTWAAASSGGGGSAAINPFQPTTMAEYKLGGLTGTTVPDSSGNNRTATLGSGAGAPTPQPYGMVYNGPFGTTTNYAGGVQYFTVPASMPDYGTFIANVCYDPGPTTWFPGLPASSGDLLGTDYSQTDKGHEVWADGPNAVSINPGYGSVANGSFVSAQSSFQGGCGVFIYTRDTSDRFFWNGTEVQYSQTGTATSNKPTTGYTVGGTPNGFNRGFTGVISHVMFLSSVLTPAQIPAVIAYSNQVISTYPGIPQPATPSSTFSSQIQGVGDSLMCGWNGSTCSISPFVYISTNTSYAFNNFGVGKQWCEDVQGFSGLKQDLSYSTGSPSITAVLCGTNNIISSSESAATIFAREMSLVSRIKRINPATRVLLFTKYSTTSSADDIKVEALAQLERTGASQYGYQLFDAQSVPAVGAANAYAGACFIDGVHPTQACVQADVSPYLSNKINQMDGAGPANPTVYSSNAVTMAPADNYATIIPTATATATLPECLGLTGSVYQIFNASAGANTITFSGKSGETISGSATLAQNAAAVFQVTLVSPTTGGCGWQRVQVATAAQVGADPAGAAAAVGANTVNGKAISTNPNITAYDIGAIAGPVAGSSNWNNAQLPSQYDSVNSQTTYIPASNATTLQMLYANAYAAELPGPPVTITASFECPIPACAADTLVPMFFNGNLSVVTSPGATIISDPLSVNMTKGKAYNIRMHFSRVSGSSVPLNTGYSANGVPSNLSPNTTTRASGFFEGVEYSITRTVADGVTNGTTTVTSATAAFGSCSTAFNCDVGQNLTTGGTTYTIVSVTNATTVVLNGSPAAGTGQTLVITPADKTLSGTIAALAAPSPAPLALLGQTGGQAVITAGLQGDSITYGTGANRGTGSWAVQALNQTGVTAGVSTNIFTSGGIPFVNTSLPGDQVSSLILTHMGRFAALTRTKYILGMLGINDLGTGGATAATLEQNLATLWTQESLLGARVYYATLTPHSNSTDGWLTIVNQSSIGSAETNRVAVNDWLRDGAPITNSTGVPAAVGTSATTANRVPYYLAGVAQVNPTSGVATASGPGVHPATGTFELANIVETAQDSGIWQVDAGNRTVTDGAMTAASNVLTSATANFQTTDVGHYVSVSGAGTAGAYLARVLISSRTNATTVVLASNAITTVTGATVTVDGQASTNMMNNGDGLHPGVHGHAIMGAAAALTVATWH